MSRVSSNISKTGQAALTSLTDSSGGVASNTIPAQTGSYVQADVRNALASLTAKVNAIIVALRASGVLKS